MRDTRETSWTLIQGAVAGIDESRDELARRYRPVVMAYLRTRWRGSLLIDEAEDAAQEVLLDLLRPDGALSRLDPRRAGGFRSYFYGVIRNVALRFEERRRRRRESPRGSGSRFDLSAAEETTVSEAFDRAWAASVLDQAARIHVATARETGPDAARRVELLRLKFAEGLPIREIAGLWGEEPERVHREYAKARREFKRALFEVVGSLQPDRPEKVEEECARLLDFFR
ncbi:MAG: sigma-70 family RNA polymerase sigma factor [Planctomycetota bacterium]